MKGPSPKDEDLMVAENYGLRSRKALVGPCLAFSRIPMVVLYCENNDYSSETRERNTSNQTETP